MTPDRIEREITIAAPVERVWSILTEAEHIGGWFADAGAEIDLRPGGALTMLWARARRVRARIEAVEPPRRFAYRWARHTTPAATSPPRATRRSSSSRSRPRATARACGSSRPASPRSR